VIVLMKVFVYFVGKKTERHINFSNQS
jgi:hypothetical protein